MAARSSWTGALLAVATAGCAPGASSATEAVIFGADDRVEVYEVTSDALREAVIRAVPGMIRADRVNVDPSTGEVTFDVNRLGPSRELCEGEAHYDQPTAPSCSATLIDDDLVLTAGHCVDGWDCRDQRFVFGWYYDAEGEIHARTSDDVFACAEVVVTEYTAANDYAIVRLDRAPLGPPMEVRTTPVVTGEPVSLAGYPFGLPMKVVENGIVNGSISASRFYARLDAQPGNSGSGVYDAELRVLGDLTNGPVEALVRDGDCNRLAVIGEDVSRTELISSIIPAIAALCASGHESERLCGECGDGTCDALEDCPADCTPDAGPPRDASVTAPDAGTRPDASSTPRDAFAADDTSALGPD
ncbi:MAG: trypsin-like peptidase domain-containing protein, partial [Deltaproteobacteria bacterium]|nr:trypsin-like peptidase domain-containing protein [Deltaproteobacteria bacterium]